MKAEALRIAMISMHSSPMGELGTRDTGGMSVYIREVARRLAATGHTVDIFTRFQHPAAEKILQPFENVRIIHLPAGPPQSVPHPVLPRQVAEFSENLERFTDGERIGYDLVHSHYWLSGQVGRRVRKRWHVPHVFMFHTLGALKDLHAATGEDPDLKRLRISVEKQLAAECDLILAATEREKRHLVELYRLSPQRIHVVPCGVDLERFRPSDPSGLPSRLRFHGEGPVILYVGRFDPVKGIDRLLTAGAMLRRDLPLRVVLVGGGGENLPEERRLKAMCSELSLTDCVTFAGRKAHEELPDYYRAADVLVLPSHYESFGLVVLEALACGTPVVAMRVGAVEDIVRNGVNGWVVPVNSTESLAEGMRSVLESQGTRSVSVEAIRQTVKDYDWSSVARSIDARYRGLLRRKNEPGWIPARGLRE